MKVWAQFRIFEFEVTNRKSSDPERAWRQLRTGFLKWVARYTADCPKERIEGAHSKILIEYFEKLKMLRNCLEFKIVPKNAKVHAKVQFVYGDGTNYRFLKLTII